MEIARIHERVSTSEQDLTRQASIEKMAVASGFYIAGIYRKKYRVPGLTDQNFSV